MESARESVLGFLRPTRERYNINRRSVEFEWKKSIVLVFLPIAGCLLNACASFFCEKNQACKYAFSVPKKTIKFNILNKKRKDQKLTFHGIIESREQLNRTRL